MSNESEDDLDRLEREMNLALRLQVLEGLATVFEKLSCRGVAGEIREGQNVTENAMFGFRLCVHGRLGPTVDVETFEVSSQTPKAKQMEESFITQVNQLLRTANYSEIPPRFLEDLRKKDVAFEARMAERRRQKGGEG